MKEYISEALACLLFFLEILFSLEGPRHVQKLLSPYLFVFVEKKEICSGALVFQFVLLSLDDRRNVLEHWSPYLYGFPQMKEVVFWGPGLPIYMVFPRWKKLFSRALVSLSIWFALDARRGVLGPWSPYLYGFPWMNRDIFWAPGLLIYMVFPG